MTPVVIGVDPGGRWCGIVARRGDQLLDHLTVTRGDEERQAWADRCLRAVRDWASKHGEPDPSWSLAMPVKVMAFIAVEDVNPPTPQLGMTNVTALLDTAFVAGMVCSYGAVLVPPDKHGCGPLLAYPSELRPTRGRGAGRDNLRHVRSAWDVAGAGAVLLRLRGAA